MMAIVFKRNIKRIVILISSPSLFWGCDHAPTHSDAYQQVMEDREKIREIIRTHLDEIKTCYKNAPKEKSALAAKFVVPWTIDDVGKVAEAHIKSSELKSREVETCAVQKLRGWSFPAAPQREVVVVSYPFVFELER